jgi:lipopolysaccharide biosynthesis glycosyltransferase
MRVLGEHREHVTYWDQYALNVVLSGRWRPLDPRWNQNAYVFRVPQWLETKFCRVECPSYADDPWIVHYNWLKPWQAECQHPFADEFLVHLAGSPWQVTFDRRQGVSPASIAGGDQHIAASRRGVLRGVRQRIHRFFGRRAA